MGDIFGSVFWSHHYWYQHWSHVWPPGFMGIAISTRQRCHTVKPKCLTYSDWNFLYLLYETHKLWGPTVLHLIFFPRSRGIWVIGEGLSDSVQKGCDFSK